jgi:hypothetical protein
MVMEVSKTVEVDSVVNLVAVMMEAVLGRHGAEMDSLQVCPLAVCGCVQINIEPLQTAGDY